MPKFAEEPIERVTIKLPKSVAAYFRKAFPHGKRSDFVAKSILAYKRAQEISTIEEGFKKLKKHHA